MMTRHAIDANLCYHDHELPVPRNVVYRAKAMPSSDSQLWKQPQTVNRSLKFWVDLAGYQYSCV